MIAVAEKPITEISVVGWRGRRLLNWYVFEISNPNRVVRPIRVAAKNYRAAEKIGLVNLGWKNVVVSYIKILKQQDIDYVDLVAKGD